MTITYLPSPRLRGEGRELRGEVGFVPLFRPNGHLLPLAKGEKDLRDESSCTASVPQKKNAS